MNITINKSHLVVALAAVTLGLGTGASIIEPTVITKTETVTVAGPTITVPGPTEYVRITPKVCIEALDDSIDGMVAIYEAMVAVAGKNNETFKTEMKKFDTAMNRFAKTEAACRASAETGT